MSSLQPKECEYEVSMTSLWSPYVAIQNLVSAWVAAFYRKHKLSRGERASVTAPDPGM